MKRLSIIIAVFLLAFSCKEPIDEFQISRGVNIAHWLSQSNVRGEERAAYFVEEEVAKNHGIPVYCGEYGCLSVKLNEDARYSWLSDMNAVFDSLGIARAVWCYREGNGGFGILSGTSTEPDAKMLECLTN